LALTSPTGGGGRSVGIVRSRTKATEFYMSRRGHEKWSVKHVLGWGINLRTAMAWGEFRTALLLGNVFVVLLKKRFKSGCAQRFFGVSGKIKTDV